MSDEERPELKMRAQKLRLFGLVARWREVVHEPWLEPLLAAEEKERQRRSFQYRIKSAHIGSFKPIADFDWKHPRKIDRVLVDELFELRFIAEAVNPIFVGPNGTGKTMIAQNLAYQALIQGITVRFCSASEMLNELASCEGAAALRRRLKQYTTPRLLAVDEVGYLSYDGRHADLLYEVVSQRYKAKVPILITTNKPFAEWNEAFPHASCVVTLVDRLCHRAEILKIEGDSFRAREAKERAARRKNRTKRTNSRPR